jgi:hypothetical protein
MNKLSAQKNETEAAHLPEKIRAARRLLKEDRAEALAALNDIFRQGWSPQPAPDGRYRGELVALDIAPGLTQLGELITAAWLPWQGKRFDAAESCGDNIFTRDSLLLAHLYWPLYRGYVNDGPNTYRAFAFQTYVGPGLTDSDRQVLKIDYDIPANPRLSIRRILDEVVQVADDVYLGKAHLKWWWGRWQIVAYFSLQQADSKGSAELWALRK